MDNKLKKSILKGSAATSIGTISGMVFQFITIMIMTRYVPKEDFGIYVLVLVIVNMFNLLGGLGVELTMVKFIASDGSEKRDVLMPVLILRAIGSLVFSFILILTYQFVFHYFDERLRQYIWYILIIFVLANYRDLLYNLMQGLNQFKHYSIVNVTSSAFRLLVVLIFIYVDKLDIENLLIIEILATLQPLLHQIIVIPFKKHVSVKASMDTYKRVIKFSIPLYLNNLVTFINGRMNIFIIGFYLNALSVANYDVASKVPEALKKIFSSFIIVYFPNLAKLFSQGDKKTAEVLIERSIGVFSLVLSFLVLFAFLFRNELTIFLFSERYAEVSLAFVLLILNFLIRGFGDLMGYALVPAGYPSVSPRVNTIASFVSISLSFLLIPIYGYMGAVYSLLIMNLVSSLLFYKFLRKYDINFHLMIFIKPTIILLAAPLSILYTGSFSSLLNFFLFIICIILGWFLNNDMKNALKFVINKLRNLKLRRI